GDLDRTELRADAERFFQRLDLSRDGAIGDPEIQAYERDIAPEIAPDFGRRAGQQGSEGAGGEDGILRLPDNDLGGRGRSRGAAVLSLLQQSQPILAADYDQSQSVTGEEFGRAADARFDRLDAAGDGRLTLSELRAIRVAPAWTGRRRSGRR
ncbi:MAG: hypothetical protein KY446_09555, partial [Proteobacteria bacterium]|nr:hypothetical protein [Pseudomonadota bacterium]